MGLHHAGFEPVNVIEWDRYCCDTIRENKACGVDAVKRWKLTAGDVRDVDFTIYEGKVQLVSGGPPCQPFSLGGKHGAHTDARDMFPEAIRALRSPTEGLHFRECEGADARRFPQLFRVYPASNGLSRTQRAPRNLGPIISRDLNGIIRKCRSGLTIGSSRMW